MQRDLMMRKQICKNTRKNQSVASPVEQNISGIGNDAYSDTKVNSIKAPQTFAENDILPDGTVFRFWEQSQRHSHTYHVAQGNPQASDENPGSEERPWRTISKAAAVLQPGERVVVHRGVYREWVQPERGGTGPDQMIWYEAAPGEDVQIKGSKVWTPEWQSVDGAWRTELDPNLFISENPFAMENFPAQSSDEWKRFPSMELRRGQLFLDEKPLNQVANREELLKAENSFWVEPDGNSLQIRLIGGASPNGRSFELTCYEQVFAPIKRGLCYIGISGFRIYHAANAVPIPPPQRGALSATAGHHWIIEDCEVGYANTIGIDLGGQWWGLPGNDRQGWHIVRRCHVHHCGVAGICGWHNLANQSYLIEDNLITDCGWMPITHHYETAGVKIHYTVNCLFRRNVLLHNRSSAALWFDGYSTNTRITQNVFHDTTQSPFGSIFIEVTQGPNLVDNNLIITSSDHGIYEHDAARMLIMQNLIANGTGSAVFLNLGDPDRKFNDVHPQEMHRVYGNILTGFEGYVVFPTNTSRSDCNVLGVLAKPNDKPFEVQGNGRFTRAEWATLDNDAKSIEIPLEISFDPKRMELRVKSQDEAKLPGYTPFALTPEIPPINELLDQNFIQPVDYQLGYEYAPIERLLQADLLGRKRTPNKFEVGPLIELLLDGSVIKVDPRRTKK
jgi:hypothetical protein